MYSSEVIELDERMRTELDETGKGQRLPGNSDINYEVDAGHEDAREHTVI
jgi:hypothetical protein